MLEAKTLVRTRNMSDQLAIPVKTIRNKCSDGTWPLEPVRIGRSIRWRQADIDKVVEGSIKIPASLRKPD